MKDIKLRKNLLFMLFYFLNSFIIFFMKYRLFLLPTYKYQFAIINLFSTLPRARKIYTIKMCLIECVLKFLFFCFRYQETVFCFSFEFCRLIRNIAHIHTHHNVYYTTLPESRLAALIN